MRGVLNGNLVTGGGADPLFFASTGLSGDQTGAITFFPDNRSLPLGQGSLVGKKLAPVAEPRPMGTALLGVGVALRRRRRA